jgi:hypothetical protein
METSTSYRLFVERPHFLTEWEFFAWRHKTPLNLVFHLFSWSMFVVPLVLLPVLRAWWLVVPMVLSIPVGSLGHYVSKDGSVRTRDFGHPNTVLFLAIIFAKICIGTYWRELEEIRSKIAASDDQELLAR